MTLVAEQLLNGLQFGLMLFLIAAGLTLVFGIMDVLNLAHGSLYMIGAYVAASVAAMAAAMSGAAPLARSTAATTSGDAVLRLMGPAPSMTRARAAS